MAMNPEVGYVNLFHPRDFISQFRRQEPSAAFAVEEGVASLRDGDRKMLSVWVSMCVSHVHVRITYNYIS